MSEKDLGSSTGVITSVNISERKRTRKTPAPGRRIELIADRGVEGDAHVGDWHRQVSFLSEESIAAGREMGLDVTVGDFGENITVEGIDMKELPLGTRVRVGDALVEISQIGKTCHTRCAIYYQAGDCIFPREGVFGWVVEGGMVAAGDTVEVISIGDGTIQHAVSDTPEIAEAGVN